MLHPTTLATTLRVAADLVEANPHVVVSLNNVTYTRHYDGRVNNIKGEIAIINDNGMIASLLRWLIQQNGKLFPDTIPEKFTHPLGLPDPDEFVQ